MLLQYACLLVVASIPCTRAIANVSLPGGGAGCERAPGAIESAIVSEGAYCPKGYDYPRTLQECSSAAANAVRPLQGDDEADTECNKDWDLMCALLTHEDNRAMFVPEGQCRIDDEDTDEYKAVCVPCVNSSYTCQLQEQTNFCDVAGLEAWEIAVGSLLIVGTCLCLACCFACAGSSQPTVPQTKVLMDYLVPMHAGMWACSVIYFIWLLVALHSVNPQDNQSGMRYEVTIDSFLWAVFRILISAMLALLSFKVVKEPGSITCCSCCCRWCSWLCAADCTCAGCLGAEAIVALFVFVSISSGLSENESEGTHPWEGQPIVHSVSWGVGAAVLAIFVVVADLFQICVCIVAVSRAWKLNCSSQPGQDVNHITVQPPAVAGLPQSGQNSNEIAVQLPTVVGMPVYTAAGPQDAPKTV